MCFDGEFDRRVAVPLRKLPNLGDHVQIHITYHMDATPMPPEVDVRFLGGKCTDCTAS
eukprot:CAMPEP_0119329216 /NCGR_PEP_ID=MMETSP1333-20130426/75351_1 /TAXON_ID=418940 /ORGANISM="Scyphosphaera apsteinii, Strain RCC1455" /LENGTH=57 /DNA_ID=CAMNT_0007338281 /DNA_START=617 /DNA_END=787 /DNA_ORIENTATION=-